MTQILLQENIRSMLSNYVNLANEVKINSCVSASIYGDIGRAKIFSAIFSVSWRPHGATVYFEYG